MNYNLKNIGGVFSHLTINASLRRDCFKGLIGRVQTALNLQETNAEAVTRMQNAVVYEDNLAYSVVLYLQVKYIEKYINESNEV